MCYRLADQQSHRLKPSIRVYDCKTYSKNKHDNLTWKSLLIYESQPSLLDYSLFEPELLAPFAESSAVGLNGVFSKHHWQTAVYLQIELQEQLIAAILRVQCVSFNQKQQQISPEAQRGRELEKEQAILNTAAMH